MNVVRKFFCWMNWCPGRVVSGRRDDQICMGWCCNICGKVKYYAPTKIGMRR